MPRADTLDRDTGCSRTLYQCGEVRIVGIAAQYDSLQCVATLECGLDRGAARDLSSIAHSPPFATSTK